MAPTFSPESLRPQETETKVITPENLLMSYDLAVAQGDFATIKTIADDAVARIRDYGQGYEFNEIFAICDGALLRSRQQG